MEPVASTPAIRNPTFLGGEQLPNNDECNIILDYVDKLRSSPSTLLVGDARAQRNEFFRDYLVCTLGAAKQRYNSTHEIISTNTIRNRQINYGWPTNTELKARFVAAITSGLTTFRTTGEFEFPAGLISKLFGVVQSESSEGPSTPSTLRENGTPSSYLAEKYHSPAELPSGSNLPVGGPEHPLKAHSPNAMGERGLSVGTLSPHTKSPGDEDNVAISRLDQYPVGQDRPSLSRKGTSKVSGISHHPQLSADSGYHTLDSTRSSFLSVHSANNGLSSLVIDSDQPELAPNGQNDKLFPRKSHDYNSGSAGNFPQEPHNVSEILNPPVIEIDQCQGLDFGRPPQNVLHSIVRSTKPLNSCPVCFLETSEYKQSRLHQIACAIAAGCETNSLDCGLTPLQALLCSAREESSSLPEAQATTLRLVEELLDRSSDVHTLINTRSRDGKTALYMAVERGQEPVVCYLLHICSDWTSDMANVCDIRGVSALMACDFAFKAAHRNDDMALMERCRNVSIMLGNAGGDYTVSENENFWPMPIK